MEEEEISAILEQKGIKVSVTNKGSNFFIEVDMNGKKKVYLDYPLTQKEVNQKKDNPIIKARRKIVNQMLNTF